MQFPHSVRFLVTPQGEPSQTMTNSSYLFDNMKDHKEPSSSDPLPQLQQCFNAKIGEKRPNMTENRSILFDQLIQWLQTIGENRARSVFSIS